MAARIPHFRYQAVGNWQKVYDFFLKYQDRLLYATDLIADKRKTPSQLKSLAEELWMKDWKFLVTDEKMEASEVKGCSAG